MNEPKEWEKYLPFEAEVEAMVVALLSESGFGLAFFMGVMPVLR